uniref:uncharacterized protein LOC118523398 isoform X1 n=1 Tax=Halichoerus grypus TaxID=9711 RepID=UPI001659D168|nr:uncharacterized protein LOC118523398 isoform X1 [Halichoerus grypus]
MSSRGPCTLETLINPSPSVADAKIYPEEITPLLPAVSGEKIAEDQTCFFLQILLKYMVIQVILRDTSLEIEYMPVHISKDLAYILFCVSVYVKEKIQFSIYFRIITAFTQNTWLLTLVVTGCVGFSLTRRLCNTSWVSCLP